MASVSCRVSLQAKCRTRPFLPLLSMAALWTAESMPLRPAGTKCSRARTLHLCQERSVMNPWITAYLLFEYLMTHFLKLAGYIQGGES